MSLIVIGGRILRDDKAAVLRSARRVFRASRIGDVDATLTFVLDREMRALNRRWRGKDRPTDVLSFSAWEGEPIPGDQEFVGDIVVSVETAARQADEMGHELHVEVAVLVAHGLLHLLGLDHERGHDEAAWQLSCELTFLAAAGIDPAAALTARAGP